MLSVFAVNSLADVVAADGLVTLREALEAANTNTAVYDAPAGSAAETDKIIIFAQDPADPGNSRITLSGQQLEILDDVEIYGPGAERMAIDANQQSRVFSVAADVDALLWGLTIMGGGNTGDGGGIYNAGTLAVRNSVVRGNWASMYGGGIYNDSGSASITDSMIVENEVDDQNGARGGVYSSGTLALVDSTVSGNLGGGIGAHGVFTANDSIISGNLGSGISLSGTATLIGSTVSANSRSGIRAWMASLSIDNSSISQNRQSGIWSLGYTEMTITGSTIFENSSSDRGGGIFSERGDNITISHSTIANNTSGDVGGIRSDRGTVTIVNSTIAENSGRAVGAICINGSGGSLSILHSTISRNIASGGLGGVWCYGDLYLRDSVVAWNEGPTHPDIGKSLAPGSGHNFFGVWSGTTSPGDTNLFGTVDAPLDPMLGPLQDNGGTTLTMAPLPGSPLIDAGNSSRMRDQYGFVMLTDQRGAARQFGEVDIGAVEFQPAGVPVARGDAAVLHQGGAITFDVLANDVRDAGTARECVLVTGPAHGVVEKSADGTLTYTPEATFWGTDTFTYRAVNGGLTSNVAEVAVSVLSPTSILVTTAEDARDGDLSPGDICLREAIGMASPGATIQFAAGMVGQVITLTDAEGPLSLSDVSIIGPGAEHLRVDAAEQSSLFTTSGNSGISHLTVSGSGKNSGIVAGAGATLGLDSLHVAANGFVESALGGYTSTSHGGGIRVEVDSTLVMSRSTVWGNAASYGGGIYCDGTAWVSGTTIGGNHYPSSGNGIHIGESGTASVTTSDISHNRFDAIFNLGDLTIADSTLSHNSGSGISNSGVLTASRSTISNNAGRGVYNKGALSVVDSTIANHVIADPGGGIYNNQGTLNVIRCNIHDNASTGSASSSYGGGGIYSRAGSVTITSSTISHNSSGKGSGGGIYCDGTLSVIGCDISHNSASGDGGGVCKLGSGETTVADSIIADNLAGSHGGGISNDYGKLTITNSVICGNRASRQGGGVNCRGELVLSNSAVSSNQTEGTLAYGGGIVCVSTTTITGSIISDNSGTHCGGIIGTKTMTITSSVISGNSATDSGGGLGCFRGTLTVACSTISGNASKTGGGVYVKEGAGPVEMVNSVLVGNSADEEGGAIANYDAPVRVVNSTIACNAAGTTGGGVHGAAGMLVMANTILTMNHAPAGADLYGILGAGSGGVLLGMEPGFVRNPSDGGDGWGDDPATAEVDEGANDDFGDLRLREDSPAVNAGIDALAVDAAGTPLPTDRDGKQRIIYGAVDIGAYEYCVTADADYSGTVDSGDAAVLAAHWGEGEMAWGDGDLNGDGRVNAADAAILAANWGRSTKDEGRRTKEEGGRTKEEGRSTDHGLLATNNDQRAAEPLVGPVRVSRVVARPAVEARGGAVGNTVVEDDAAVCDAALASEYGPWAAAAQDRWDVGGVARSRLAARRRAK